MKSGLIIAIVIILVVLVGAGAIVVLNQQKTPNVAQNNASQNVPAGTTGNGAAQGETNGQPANIDNVASLLSTMADQENSILIGQDGGSSIIDAEIKAINDASNSYDETKL